jgi:hypothetical protein
LTDKIHIDPQVKVIVRLVKDYLWQLVRYWYLLIIFVVLANVASKMKKTDPVSTKYVATLTFTINQSSVTEQTTEEGEVASLVTDFGFGGTRSVNTNRLIELSKSDAVLSAVLFRTYEVEGDSNYLANHFLNIYNPNIKDSTYFKDFVSLDSLNRVENAVLNGILARMRGNNVLFTVSPAQIYKLTTSSVKEELSKVMAEAYYEALSDLYIKGSVAKAERTVMSSKTRLDSARIALQQAEVALASWQDRNQALVKRTAFLTQNELQRRLTMASRDYSEALMGYDRAQVRLESIKPIFQTIDPPRYPLQRVVSGGGGGIPRMIAIGGAVFIYILVVTVLFAYKKYGYLLKEILEA